MIIHKDGNIADAYKNGELIAHCVSSDFEMGIGVAKVLADLIPEMREDLRKAFPRKRIKSEFKPMVVSHKEVIWNLVTKYRYYDKPTVTEVRESLLELRRALRVRFGESPVNVKKISMPKIASGADKIPWDITEAMIDEIFAGDEFIITIYRFSRPRVKHKV